MTTNTHIPSLDIPSQCGRAGLALSGCIDSTATVAIAVFLWNAATSQRVRQEIIFHYSSFKLAPVPGSIPLEVQRLRGGQGDPPGSVPSGGCEEQALLAFCQEPRHEQGRSFVRGFTRTPALSAAPGFPSRHCLGPSQGPGMPHLLRGGGAPARAAPPGCAHLPPPAPGKPAYPRDRGVAPGRARQGHPVPSPPRSR